MRKETVEIDGRLGKEYAGKYVFQEISWAKRSRIIQKHTNYHPTTGQVTKSDYVAIQAETIWASLKEQPESKPITLEKLLSEEDGVPLRLGELFSKVVNRLCSVTLEDSHFLSEPCEEERHIQASQSSGFAKSSDGPRDSSRNSQQKSSKSSS
jgi:hypothetical protein